MKRTKMLDIMMETYLLYPNDHRMGRHFSRILGAMEKAGMLPPPIETDNPHYPDFGFKTTKSHVWEDEDEY